MNRYFKTTTLTYFVLLSACATNTPISPPAYATGYTLQTQIPENKAQLLYHLMDRSGLANLLAIQGRVVPTDEMASTELQQKMDRLQRREYAKCLVNEVRSGPSYYSLIAETDKTLTTQEVKALLKFFNTETGTKIRNANNQASEPMFTPEEEIFMRDYKTLWNKQLYAAAHFNHWIPYYNDQVKHICLNWFKEHYQ